MELLPRHPEDTGYPVGESPVGRVDPAIQPDRAYLRTGNAISSYKNSIKQIVALREVVNQGKQTLDLSLDLYKQGLTPFQNVLDAQRSLLTYQNQLTQAQGSSLLNLIQLYQSLGGGCRPFDPIEQKPTQTININNH